MPSITAPGGMTIAPPVRVSASVIVAVLLIEIVNSGSAFSKKVVWTVKAPSSLYL